MGENSLYLPIEKRLVSKTGRGVMPDGFAIIFSKTPEIYVVEVELSKHDLDKHIVEQLNRFGRALRNPDNRKKIADRLHREIKKDLMKEAFVKQMIGSKEIYKFLSDLVSSQLKTVIIIEHKDRMIVEACEGLKRSPEVLQFRSYAREDAPTVKAHIIEPLREHEDIGFVETPVKTGVKKRYTEDSHLRDVEEVVASIYGKVKTEIMKIDLAIKVNAQRYYISLRKRRNFAFIKIRKKKMHIVIMIPYEVGDNLIKKHKLTQLSEGIQRFYNGACFQVTLENEANFEEILRALEEAYKRQS